jgi:hypothetical protein
MDIQAVFTEYCGPSVLFIEANNSGRTLKVTYTIPALDSALQRFVVTHLRNGLERTLWHAVRRCAADARNDAYRRTGHREADIKELLAGRLVG